MIPKKIHYVWVGHNPKSPIIEECIATWKKKLPDYQIIEWNEDNFDMHENRYIETVSYTHLTLPTTLHECRSRWSPYH